MPVTPTYPGVYVEEIPSGVRTIVGVSTSVTAFVGYTPTGPVDKAVRVLNLGDYERNFGGLHRDSLISYAVRQFFLNGGTEAYIIRVALGAVPAQVTIQDTQGNDVLTVEAASAGKWGNDLRLEIDYDTSNPDSTFNLEVVQYELLEGKSEATVKTKELFRNLSMNSHSSTYAINVVNNGSDLIKLTRPSLSFSERGWSMSGDLSTFPTLDSDETRIAVTIDGVDAYTLVIDPASVSTPATLKTAITTAISNKGLSSRLEADTTDALGVSSPTGKFLKISSKLVSANPNTADEYSSVQISKARSNDASKKLLLGLANGGREKEGASEFRPAASGTISGDLAGIWGNTAPTSIKVHIKDWSTGSAVEAVVQTITIPASTAIGTALRDELQKEIRASVNHAAAKKATVELFGTYMRILTSSSKPNFSVEFSLAGATTLKLTSAAGGFPNAQQYSVGTGVTFGAQTGAVPGDDGTLPTATEIIGDYDDKTGIYALRDVDIFNILSIPRTTLMSESEAKAVIAEAISFCEDHRAFFILDPDPNQTLTDISDWLDDIDTSSYAAVYFPQIKVADPLDEYRLKAIPVSGTIAGIYSRTDSERGVWKAPAGIEATMSGVQDLTYTLTDGENGILNPLGINCLRAFPVYGNLVWGARTREGADQLTSEWKYIPIRRLALFIEESLFRGTKWVVFEPNDEPLWAKIRMNVGAFMMGLFRQGAFQGSTPDKAFFVKCDAETTTQADRNLGIVNIVVGFAPLKPAEFVIIKIQQIPGDL